MHRSPRDPLNSPTTPTWSAAARQRHSELMSALDHTPPSSRRDAVHRCASDLAADLDEGRIASTQAEAILTQLIRISQTVTNAPVERSRPRPP